MSGSPAVPKLGKSTDGGVTWQVRDLTAALRGPIPPGRLPVAAERGTKI